MSLSRLSLRLLLATAGLVAALGSANAQESAFVPVTDAVLRNQDPADWLRWRGNHTASGYSPLDQVNRENVQKLGLAWTWTMEPGTQEQEPIVYNGVMYLPQPENVVQALDAVTGELIWEYRRELPKDTSNGATRNIAIYQDKVFLGTQDAYLVRGVGDQGGRLSTARPLLGRSDRGGWQDLFRADLQCGDLDSLFPDCP